MFKRFKQDDRGATAIEYTVLAAAMAVLVFATWPILVGAMQSMATTVAGVATGYK